MSVAVRVLFVSGLSVLVSLGGIQACAGSRTVATGSETPTAVTSPAAPTPSPAPLPVVPAPKKPDRRLPVELKSKKAEPKSPTPAKAGKSTQIPPLLQEVEANYTAQKTLKADFTQVHESATLHQKKTSTGTLKIKRPSKVHWEEKKPDQSLMISDGVKFWFYTPPFDEGDPGKVIESRAASVQSKLLNALLAGKFSENRGMKILVDSPTQFVLIPKPGTAGTVEKAELEINLEKKVIQRVFLHHKGGNKAEITLSNIEVGIEIPDDLFVFKAPPNTEKSVQ